MTDMRSFQDVLTDLQDGEVHRQLGEALREVVRAVEATNQAGELSLKLSVRREGRMVCIVPKVAKKIPTPKTEATVFFASTKGDLSLDDHKQLQLREVPKAPSSLRSIKEGAE